MITECIVQNKVEILCGRDHAMLSEFSRRALVHIIGRPFRSLQLPFVGEYMNANVLKEADKDRIIIEHAADGMKAGISPDDLDVETVFKQTQEVDHQFVKKISIPSLSIQVRYEDIAEVRKKRIRCLSAAVYDLLGNWQDPVPFEARVSTVYSKQELKELMREVLHLYNQETLILSHSIKFFHPFNIAINSFAETVFDAMELAAEELTADCIAALYGEKGHV